MNCRVDDTRILLIEDDCEVRDTVAALLKKKGYHIEQCNNGADGLITAINQPFHLILLDKLLPGLDGLELLQRLRQHRDTPVIMLTACGAEQDRIDGFNSGADDYLPKPFSLTELLLRVNALLRRTLPQESRTEKHLIELDSLRLDRHELQLQVHDEHVAVTPTEFELLWELVSHHNEVLSKPFLYQRVLRREFSRYDRSLDMHLSRIRRKLKSAGLTADRVKTVHGKGYRFV